MKPLVTMRAALDDPDLFGRMLAGESWAPWRALLIASMGEKLTDDERAIFRHITGREREPLSRVDELHCVIGRRGGKTRAAAVFAAYVAALCDHADKLAPGERGVLPIMSASTWQAQKAFGFLVGIFADVPALKALVENETADTLSLSTRVDIECRPASFRTVRGSTFVAAVADEVAFWRSDETSRNPDTAILAATRPALATTGGPLIVISSPYARSGELWNVYRRDYGPEGDPQIIVAKAPSRVMNPTLPARVVERAYERDPAAARAEYDAEFRDDVSGFIDFDSIEAAVERGVSVRAPVDGVTYIAFADPSGGSGSDSFTAAICHAVGDRIILDCILERKPPLSPASVIEEFSAVLKTYCISRIRSDRYAGLWPTEAWSRQGIVCEPADLNRSEIYLAFLPLLNSGRLLLLDNQRMIGQFVGLERRTSRVGRDIVDAGPGAHEDVANAVAGALTLACGASEPGILGYYREEIAALERGDHPFALTDRSKKMRVLAPANVSCVQVLSGRTFNIPADRVLELDEDDARPLFRAGFVQLGKDAA